mgnify:CR=1 FL=1
MKKLVMVMVAVLTAAMFMSSVDAEQKGEKDQASVKKCEKTSMACIDKAKFKSDKDKCQEIPKKCIACVEACPRTGMACMRKAKIQSDKEKCEKVVRKCESDCLAASKAPKGK